uniref:Uncharacterized protein n=1 Tax=Panagrellus redivivus TaxID=6233 RepID=A0A7E4W2B3_PANRE
MVVVTKTAKASDSSPTPTPSERVISCVRETTTSTRETRVQPSFQLLLPFEISVQSQSAAPYGLRDDDDPQPSRVIPDGGDGQVDVEEKKTQK